MHLNVAAKEKCAEKLLCPLCLDSVGHKRVVLMLGSGSRMLSNISSSCWRTGKPVFPLHLLPDVGKRSETEAITLSCTIWAFCPSYVLPTCTVFRPTENSTLFLNIFSLLLFSLCLTDQCHDTSRDVLRSMLLLAC